VFREHRVPAVRRQHGATGHSISREATDPNSLLIVNEFATLEGARAFDGPSQVWIADEAESKRY